MDLPSTLWGLDDKQWIWLATIVFASSFFLGTYSALILRRKTGRPYILSLVTFGWILQTIGLYARGLAYGGCPLANRFELVQFVVWSAIALYIFVGPAFDETPIRCPQQENMAGWCSLCKACFFHAIGSTTTIQTPCIRFHR